MVLDIFTNIFEFNGQLYKQLIGAAMGSAPIPAYANIFMARKLDKVIIEIIEQMSQTENILLEVFKRFLDDLFFIFIGNMKVLHKILDLINLIHPSIKFTMKHTFINELDPCDCKRTVHIPFLDVSLSLKNGKISTDLYKKSTDKNLYRLPSSVHPMHCTKNIPYSLAMRIIKICSETTNRDLRLLELKQMLLDRDYEEQLIDSEIKRALNIPRESALNPNHSTKKENDRPIYVSTFDPRLPIITKSIQKHWQTSCFLDANFRNTFPKPPMVAFYKT